MPITKEKETKVSRKADPLEEAVLKMANYRELHLRQQAIAAEKKEVEKQLFELAEAHPEWFQRSKTLTLDVYGKIAYTNENVIVYDLDKFDELEFATAYKELVKIEPRVSAVKGYCINDEVAADLSEHGVSLGTREKFTVTPNK